MAWPQISALVIALLLLLILSLLIPFAEVDVHRTWDLSGLMDSTSAMNDGATIPKRIFMFWDKGWEVAPTLQTACKDSWRLHNPGYELHLLNLSHAEWLVERPKYVAEEAWHAASIQAKSDIIRVLLLAKYGGIWADATLYCLEPLDNWLNFHEPFLAYQRHDVRHTDVYKWVTLPTNPTHRWTASWFLAAHNKSTIIQQWKRAVVKFWRQKEHRPNKPIPYHWVHRLFFDLRHRSYSFKAATKRMEKLGANGPHCLTHGRPHMYKLSAGSCKDKKQEILHFLASQSNFNSSNSSDIVPYGHSTDR